MRGVGQLDRDGELLLIRAVGFGGQSCGVLPITMAAVGHRGPLGTLMYGLGYQSPYQLSNRAKLVRETNFRCADHRRADRALESVSGTSVDLYVHALETCPRLSRWIGSVEGVRAALERVTDPPAPPSVRPTSVTKDGAETVVTFSRSTSDDDHCPECLRAYRRDDDWYGLIELANDACRTCAAPIL